MHNYEIARALRKSAQAQWPDEDTRTIGDAIFERGDDLIISMEYGLPLCYYDHLDYTMRTIDEIVDRTGLKLGWDFENPGAILVWQE